MRKLSKATRILLVLSAAVILGLVFYTSKNDYYKAVAEQEEQLFMDKVKKNNSLSSVRYPDGTTGQDYLILDSPEQRKVQP